MEDLIMKALTAIVELAVFAGLGYLIKYLNVKIGNDKLQKYYGYVKIAVQAIEQMMGPGQGEVKKAEVIKYVSEKLGGKLSEADLNMLIEAAVKEMNLVLKGNGLEPTSYITLTATGDE